MANSKSPVVRIVVPLLLVGLGLLVAWSVWRNATTPITPPASPQQPAQQPAQPAAAPASPTQATPPADAQPAEQPPAAPLPPLSGLRARPVDGPMTPEALTPIGSLDPDAPENLWVQFNPIGAGIESIRLAEHFTSVDRTEHDEVQATLRFQQAAATIAVPPMAALTLEIDGIKVDLASPGRRIWAETAPGRFEAIVEDDSGAPVARVVRRYTLGPEQHHLRLEQHVENLSGRALNIRWYQYGPTSLARGTPGYGGDTRRVRFGYLLSPTSDPSQQHVESGRFLIPQSEAVGRAGSGGYPDKTLWPNRTSQKDNLGLVFVATTNRYHAAAVFPLIDAAASLPDKRLHAVERIDRFVIPAPPDRANSAPPIVLRLQSPQTTLAPGQRADLSLGFYAGPLSRPLIDANDATRRVGLGELVVYTFGGPCAFCTFQSLTYALLAFLRFLHGYVLFDWALAIIALVFAVRLILHPVTKWSQTSMYRFGKQMQALAPKQKKIQEKYKDDPRKMREELARVMREENINYAGALGCLPMFLQMPIWIALFAMLFFTFELRHQPAFFGLFQALTGGRWHFLADLAEPDRFIPLPVSIWIPWISSIMGPIASINILPLLLGVVFYIQQKYLTPQTTMTLTPEQEAQQKMIKVMMVVMFPLFMYNAPSGLALYFITNSTLAIIESRHIRRHAEKLDEERARQPRQPRKAPGFFARLQEQVEARRKLIEQMQKQQQSRPGGRRDGRDPRSGHKRR